MKNISQVIAELRMQKDGDEVALVREAIGITDKALQYVMKHLEPGMAEYQAQADFEYMIRYNGAEGTAFPTMQEAVRTEPCFTTTQTLTFVRMVLYC